MIELPVGLARTPELLSDSGEVKNDIGEGNSCSPAVDSNGTLKVGGSVMVGSLVMNEDVATTLGLLSDSGEAKIGMGEGNRCSPAVDCAGTVRIG